MVLKSNLSQSSFLEESMGKSVSQRVCLQGQSPEMTSSRYFVGIWALVLCFSTDWNVLGAAKTVVQLREKIVNKMKQQCILYCKPYNW